MLTAQQTRVIQLYADGLNYAEIGKSMHIAESTVKGHAQAAFTLLGARNMAHGIAIAFRKGIIK